MSQQRHASHDPVREPHSISLKVLRLSRPSLAAQHPLPPAATPSPPPPPLPRPIPASLAYAVADADDTHYTDKNPPFLLSPILNLPPSFGSAYVGETFSCTLCASHDARHDAGAGAGAAASAPAPRKYIRDVRIEAEMKTPGSMTARVGPGGINSNNNDNDNNDNNNDDNNNNNKSSSSGSGSGSGGVQVLELLGPAGADAGAVDLEEPGETLQRVVHFELREEGTHVLCVTVSYYEATATSGRSRSFRKLYQFVCRPSLVVRTKASPLPEAGGRGPKLKPKPKPKQQEQEEEQQEEQEEEQQEEQEEQRRRRRRWALEAQLENCSEETLELERVGVLLEGGGALLGRDCNWEAAERPVLRPGEVEQVCFVIEETGCGAVVAEPDGRILFGVLGIRWRTEMGQTGYLATNRLGTRHVVST